MPTDDLRPNSLDEYIGQEALKERLQISIEAARLRGKPMDHLFLYGPAGAGKTSLGMLMANALGVPLEVVTMPISNRALANIISEFEGVLLLDELHRPSDSRQEELLPLLEFNYMYSDRGYQVEAGAITIIGATTNRTKVIEPLRGRFPIKPDFDPYSDTEMGQIVAGMAAKIGLDLDKDSCIELGKATGGIPRNARQFVLTARDMFEVDGVMPLASSVLELCRVAPDGLTLDHLRHLQVLAEAMNPVGLRTLSMLLEQNEDGVQDIERLLLKRNMIRLTDRGRDITKVGRARIKNVT